MRSKLAAGLATVALLAGGPLGCTRLLYNYATVTDGEVLRSGQPSPLFLSWVHRRHGLRSLVNLRGDTEGYESAFAAREGLRLFSFNLSASTPPSEADVQRFLGIVTDPANFPVLVHCRNGVDRTGYMLALYRVQEQGWDVDRAAREMNRHWQFSLLNAVPQQVLKEGLRKR